jgi:hypothetical protein
MRIALAVVSLLAALLLVMFLTRHQIQSSAPALAQLHAASTAVSAASGGRVGTALGLAVESTLSQGASRSGAEDER